MISLTDYLMGRDVGRADELTEAVEANARELLGRINLLLSWALADGVRAQGVASGWRPRGINDATANAAKNSTHLSGEGIDLRDTAHRDLVRWCLLNLDALEEIGLWMEDPQWTPSWVHLQSRPPGSGRRVYVPSTRPPLISRLTEQDAAA
jgi:hypothetical protein